MAGKLNFLMFWGKGRIVFLLLGRKKSLQGRAVFGRSRGVKLKAFKARFNGFTEMFAEI